MSQSPRLGGVSPEEAALEWVDVLQRHRAAMAAMGLLRKLRTDADDPLVAIDFWRGLRQDEQDAVPVEEGGVSLTRTRLVKGCVDQTTTQVPVYLARGADVIPFLDFSQTDADFVRDTVVNLESTRARLASAQPVDFTPLPDHISAWSASSNNG
jgi:hypothetical protein